MDVDGSTGRRVTQSEMLQIQEQDTDRLGSDEGGCGGGGPVVAGNADCSLRRKIGFR